MRLLVVCAGNTCRSPAAEAAIRRAAEIAGLSVEVTSAGTSAERTGTPPTPAMVTAGRRRGLDISGSSTQVTADQIESADLILAMDHQTQMFLGALSSGARIELLGSYEGPESLAEIVDPYGGDDAVYEATLDRIITASEALVASLSD